jgi:hypothetical protein
MNFFRITNYMLNQVVLVILIGLLIQKFYGNPLDLIFGPFHNSIADEQVDGYSVSLITLTNPKNQFYYHTTISFQHVANGVTEQKTYGFFPDHANSFSSRFYQFFRSFFSIKARVISPDPLLNKAKIIHRETFTLDETTYNELKNTVENNKGYYSYFGFLNSDNCSSWVRRLLENVIEIRCNSFRVFGYEIPVLFFDFPYLCHSTI